MRNLRSLALILVKMFLFTFYLTFRLFFLCSPHRSVRRSIISVKFAQSHRTFIIKRLILNLYGQILSFLINRLFWPQIKSIQRFSILEKFVNNLEVFLSLDLLRNHLFLIVFLRTFHILVEKYIRVLIYIGDIRIICSFLGDASLLIDNF